MAKSTTKSVKKTASNKVIKSTNGGPVSGRKTKKEVKKVATKKVVQKRVTPLVEKKVEKNKLIEKTTSKAPEIKLPSLQEMLEAGAHFGHKTSRWHPKMERYIFDTRNGIHIIDLTQTLELLKEAVEFLSNASMEGNILLVGTKGQAATLVKNAGMDHGALYVSRKWPGGLLTNYKNIKKSVKKLMGFEENLASGKGYETKKEKLVMDREKEKLKKQYEGILFMEKDPSALIVIDTKIEKNAIREARSRGIKVVGLIDTNCDPNLVDYPIPANDDAIKSISLFMDVLVQAFSGSRTSIELAGKRNDYVTNLDKIKRDSEAEIERMKREEELEQRKLKEMKENAGRIVRVVRKKTEKK
ncbi:MAG: 30S ribosomal protein S2 [bacterium]